MDVSSNSNKVSGRVLYKLIQRRTFTFLNSCWGFTLCILLVYFSLYSIFAYFAVVLYPNRTPFSIFSPLNNFHNLIPLFDQSNPCDLKSLRGYAINEEILSRCRRFNEYKSQFPTDHDSISGINSLNLILHHGPIDAVYTWVNGSDPVWLKKKNLWSIKNKVQISSQSSANVSTAQPATNSSVTSMVGNETFAVEPDSFNVSVSTSFSSTTNSSANESEIDDSMSPNRYRDSNELKYSLRSLIRNAPWIRHIYIVTDNQVPSWLNLESGKLTLISHEDIFENKSHLPVFSSPAIEAHIHRIPGLSKKFIYFNDDVFLGSPVLPEDFVSSEGSQLFHMSWDVPKCAPGCADSWLGDGFCDKSCNVSSCGFDYPDCVNASSTGNTGQRSGSGGFQSTPQSPLCAVGCPEGWLADKVCDSKCKSEDCGWDAGDCGLDMIVDSFPVGVLTEQNVHIYTNDVADTVDAPGDRPVLEEFFGNEFVNKDLYDENFKYHDDMYIQDMHRRPYYDTIVEDFPDDNAATLEVTTLPPTSQPVEDVVHGNTSAATTDRDNTTVATNNTSHGPVPVQSPSKPSPAVILQAELGTKAVYFNLTYFWCKLCSNNSCSTKLPHVHKNKTITEEVVKYSDCRYSGAEFEEASDADTNPRVVHTATILSKHNVLVVVLYSEQEDKPAVPTRFPYNITFTVSGSRTTTTVVDGNETASHDILSASFVLQITEGRPKAPPLSYSDILPHGMGLIDSASSFCVSCERGSEPGHHLLPLSSTQIYPLPYSSERNPIINSTHVVENITAVTHHRAFAIEEAAVLKLNLDRRVQNDSLHAHRFFHRHNLSQVAVRYKVTLRNGSVFSCTLPLWEVVLKFHPPKSVSSKIFLPVANHRQSHVDEFLHSFGASDLVSFHQSDSLLTENKQLGLKQIKALEAVMHDTTLLFLAVPMPISWASSPSQWVHSKVEVLAMRTNGSTSTLPVSLSDTAQTILWREENPSKNGSYISDNVNVGSRNPAYFLLACLTAVFRWGGFVLTNDTVTGNAVNLTTNSSSPSPSFSNSSSAAFYRRRLQSYFAPLLGTSVVYAILSVHHFPSMVANAVATFVGNALKQLRHQRTRRRRRLDLDTYGSSLVHVNRLYNKAFGNELRKVPAHLPHMMDKDIVSEMQQMWPKEWNETSQHRFRSPKDMQYSFSYYYYVYHRPKVFPVSSELMATYLSAAVDTNHDGYLCDNEFRTLAAIIHGDAPKEDFIASLRECLSNSSESYRKRFNRTEEAFHHTSVGSIHKSFTLLLHPTVLETLNCSMVVNGLKDKIDWKAKGAPAAPVMGSDKDFVAFEMIGDNYTDSLRQLDSVRARQSKFVCINDNMQHPPKELEKALQDFYESFFPLPSIFELKAEARNPTLYRDEYMRLRRQGDTTWADLIGQYSSALFLQTRFYVQYAWSGLTRTLKAAILAVARYLIFVFDSEENDAEYYINGMRQEIARKPSVPASQPGDAHSTTTENISFRLTSLFSVIALACIIILRSLVRRKRNRSSLLNQNQGNNASVAEKERADILAPSSPQDSNNSPSNRFARKKTALKTPSKSERRAAALEAEYDEEEDAGAGSGSLRGVDPVRFEMDMGSDDEEDEDDDGEEGTRPDPTERKFRDSSYLGSLLSSVGLRSSISPSPIDSDEQAAESESLDDEAQGKGALPSKHAAPAKSGLRKNASKGAKKDARVHWDKSVTSPGSSSAAASTPSAASNIINAIRNGPGPRAAINKMLGYS